ncbi:hypothetical protein D3Z38_10815 [Clostridiales bacterium]|nr:hypothetical protein [Clostridiales bacterium]
MESIVAACMLREVKIFSKNIRKLLQFGMGSAIIQTSKEVRTFSNFKEEQKKGVSPPEVQIEQSER